MSDASFYIDGIHPTAAGVQRRLADLEAFLHGALLRYARPAAEYPDCLPPMFPREELGEEIWFRLNGEWVKAPTGPSRAGLPPPVAIHIPFSGGPTNEQFDAVIAGHLLRRLINKLAQILALVSCPESTYDGRASGSCMCQTCGEVYFRHARHPLDTWMTMLCDGRMVKL